MKPESIAILLDSAPITWTSQEDRQLKLCEALVERGVRPILVFSQELSPEFAARLRNGGAELAAINYNQGRGHYLTELRKLVNQYSITTAHIIFFDYFSALPRVAKQAGITHIIYEMQNSGEFRATSWKKILLQLRTKVTTSAMTKVIAISQFVRTQLIKGGLAESKIVVRYLGVDTARFVPHVSAREQWAKDFNVAPDELILSTVSYLRPFKQPHVLVEMCAELAARNVPARLFVAGDGDMLPSLRELTERLGVTDRIHWLGNVPDPKSLLQASDVFVLASVGEAFGLVLAEAMACGVPIVGSRHGSLPEVVVAGETGLLATPLNAKAFADAVEKLSRNPELRKKLGRQALDHVRRNFTVEKAVAETINIYERLWS
ncbi:MAG TPA: glycosyltransferase family 4 protein [Pyrinomonadaceae bacterium]|nr:glycosyltransferase family 4 protein [Pyrinomonadaceae bacterium]